tara:strand:- start:28 stop:2142 length:2115 start_codon:yes stop_codon:yes gene_type:complete
MGIQQLMLGGGGKPKLYREDLFATYHYAGNNSTSRGINVGIDLAGKGGFVWTKDIDNTNGGDDEGALVMYDTIRGATKGITVSGGTGEGTHSDGVTAFTSSGYTVSNRECTNKSTTNKMAYVFRKEPKFMDIKVVDGQSSSFLVAHDLGVKPAFIMMKRTNSTGNYWRAWHKDLGNCVGNNSGNADTLNIHFSQNGTGAESEISGDNDYRVGLDASATHVRVPSGSNINSTYQSAKVIIIMFASHEGSSDYPSGEFGPSSDQDIIKCGFYNGNGATTDYGGPLIDLGWDPEFLMIGRMHGTYGGYVNIFDQTRGMRTPVAEHVSEAFRMSEANPGKVGHSNRGPCTFNNGFKIKGNHMDYNRNVEGGQTITNPYWYVAIRRADGVVGKEPTSANRRFDVSTYTSTSEPVITENFQIDASIIRKVTVSDKPNYMVTRPTGREFLLGNKGNDSEGESDFKFAYQTAAHAGNMTSQGSTYFMNWHRSNSFDAIQWTGNGSTRTITHNMGVAPEMIWIKSLDIRTAAGYGSATSQSNNSCNEYTHWICWHKDINGGGNNAINYDFELNCSGTNRNNTNGFKAIPTATGFQIGSNSRLNGSNYAYVAWLFAPKDGECKMGSFTQNGSNATEVDLGFNPKFMIAWQDSGSNKFMFSTAWTWGSSASATTKTWYLNNYSNDAFAWADAPHRITNGFSWPSGSDTWLYYAHA